MARWYDSKGLTFVQAVDIPPMWLLAALVLAWLQAQLLPGFTFVFWPAQWLGGAMVLIGICLMSWAIASFRTHNTSVVPHQVPARIITSGPFRFTRNPIYLGDVLVLSGAVLWWGAWPSALLIPLFGWIVVRRFIAPEEVRMKENFAAEFEEFCQKTPRWL